MRKVLLEYFDQMDLGKYFEGDAVKRDMTRFVAPIPSPHDEANLAKIFCIGR